MSPPRIDKLPSKLRFFRRSSTSMKYVADYSVFVSDVHIKLTNPMTNVVIWQIQLFAKGAISTNIVVELSLVYSYTNPSIQIQVHRAARRRFLGERAAATYEALSRAQRNISIEFVSLLFSDR